MRNPNLLLHAWKLMGLFGIGMVAVVTAKESTAAASNEVYTWSAELVAYDDASSTITVKSRLVETAGSDELAELAAGDRVILAWSGISTAAGVRAVERDADASLGRLTLPIEYVTSELDGRYVVFRVRILAENAAAIKALPAGAWVTATSPYQATEWMEAVESIRPYNDVN